jgi:pyridoxine kinase
MLKRIAAIHDISGFGKCSLTVALPIISAAGIEVSVIPTAVLSTHTGGFTGFTYRDLAEDILPITDHWCSLDLKFDALYTGFLGSFEQLNIMGEVFDRLRTADNLILVDPVMADNGVLYKVFPDNFPDGMRKLCAKADIIVPNLTEAALLTGQAYKEGPYTREYIEETLKKLAALGPRRIVLTGVYFNNSQLGAASYDSHTGEVDYTFSPRIEGYYHGTGDVFASVLLSAVLRGFSLAESAQIAVDFTAQSIERTRLAGTDVRFGVNFEEGLPMLMQRLIQK